MQETNLNTGKQTTPVGEEAETVDSAGEISGMSIRISSINNLRDLNSVGKLPESQPRNATVAEERDTTQISAIFALRHSATPARSKATF